MTTGQIVNTSPIVLYNKDETKAYDAILKPWLKKHAVLGGFG